MRVGWSITLYWNNNRGLQLIEDADFREKVFQNMELSEMRRGARLFTDCFKGAELVDLLLDRGLVKHEVEAVAMGQELLFQGHITSLYIPKEEACLEIDFADKKKGGQSSRKNQSQFATKVAMEKKMNSFKFRRALKKTLAEDPPFRDGQSLYTLNIMGEIMTEYLQQTEISEPLVLKEQARAKFEGLMQGVSFGLFGPLSPFRRACASLVCSSHFEYLVLFVIVLSR
jgi:hypothetical protein